MNQRIQLMGMLIRQKSAQTTIKKCSNDNFHKILYFNRKSLCNILGAEWHLLPLGEEKDNKFKFI